jgi:glycosyltransferase involved in cell wall biosynthesis
MGEHRCRLAVRAVVTTSADGLRLALFTDTFTPQINGVSRTLERLSTVIRERGGDILTFTTSDPDAEEHEDVRRYPSVPFWAYPQLRLAAPSRAEIVAALEEFHPTLVHAATPFGIGLAGRAAARMLDVPFVTSYHTSFSAYAQYYHLSALSAPGWAYLRWFHNSGLRTYCPSRAIQGELATHEFENVAIWGRGVETQRFNPTFRSRDLRAELGAEDATILVGYVGRLALEKGLDVALAALPLVLEQTTANVRFVFVGDGPYESECRARTLPQTTFVGRQTGTALSTLYASMDIFLFPSVTDTFGNVLLEAAASRLAIVAANVGPTRELVGEQAGALFTPGDANALAATLAHVIADTPTRIRLAEAALTLARQRSWPAVFDTLIEDYQHLAHPRVLSAAAR